MNKNVAFIISYTHFIVDSCWTSWTVIPCSVSCGPGLIVHFRDWIEARNGGLNLEPKPDVIRDNFTEECSGHESDTNEYCPLRKLSTIIEVNLYLLFMFIVRNGDDTHEDPFDCQELEGTFVERISILYNDPPGMGISGIKVQNAQQSCQLWFII